MKLTVIILADLLVIYHVLYVLQVLCIKINAGTKVTLKSNDLNKFVCTNAQIRYITRTVPQNTSKYL